MEVTVDNLLHKALSLSEDDRALLAERILESVDRVDIMQAWGQEAERRLNELETGQVKGLSPEEVMKYVEERRKLESNRPSRGAGRAG
jgi:putative addiction module component (TIGR02574 family)